MPRGLYAGPVEMWCSPIGHTLAQVPQPALEEGLHRRGLSLERAPDEAHLPSVAERLRVALEQRPGAALVMTGRAQALQALRSRLRADGVGATQKVKAYWSAGKSGLD